MARGDGQHRGRTMARAHIADVQEARESEALRLYAQGMSQLEIAGVMELAQSTVCKLISRGLERRAAEDKKISEQARTLILMRLELMFSSWFPLATGDNPNDKAAQQVLAILDRLAKLNAVYDISNTVNINVTTANADVMRAEITRDLDALESRQQKIIDGTLELET